MTDAYVVIGNPVAYCQLPQIQGALAKVEAVLAEMSYTGEMPLEL